MHMYIFVLEYTQFPLLLFLRSFYCQFTIKSLGLVSLLCFQKLFLTQDLKLFENIVFNGKPKCLLLVLQVQYMTDFRSGEGLDILNNKKGSSIDSRYICFSSIKKLSLQTTAFNL
jgi:hypothetical protein